MCLFTITINGFALELTFVQLSQPTSFLCLCLQGFPIGLPVDKFINRVPWLNDIAALPYGKITKLAGNGQSLPVIGAITTLVLFSCEAEASQLFVCM